MVLWRQPKMGIIIKHTLRLSWGVRNATRIYDRCPSIMDGYSDVKIGHYFQWKHLCGWRTTDNIYEP